MEEVIQIDRFTCAICLSNEIPQEEECTTNCNHKFCLSCINHWFNQETTTCPLCRAIITSYNNTEGTHHIISIMNSGNNNNNDNQNDNNLAAIIQLKTRIYYLKFTVLISFIYFIYSLYQTNNLIFERNRYEILYKNCTEKLDISNQVITIMSDNDSLSPLPVYFNNHLYNCFFPLYYINKCYLGIPGQH